MSSLNFCTFMHACMHAIACTCVCIHVRVRVYLQRSDDVGARNSSESAARRGCTGNRGRESQGV
jgi:hypothetical protein